MISDMSDTPEWPSIGKFRFWLDSTAKHRPRTFTYHYGFLARDRVQWIDASNSILNTGKWVKCEAVEEMAKLAWSAFERGEVTLAQRKLGLNRYEYIAIRR